MEIVKLFRDDVVVSWEEGLNTLEGLSQDEAGELAIDWTYNLVAEQLSHIQSDMSERSGPVTLEENTLIRIARCLKIPMDRVLDFDNRGNVNVSIPEIDSFSPDVWELVRYEAIDIIDHLEDILFYESGLFMGIIDEYGLATWQSYEVIRSTIIEDLDDDTDPVNSEIKALLFRLYLYTLAKNGPARPQANL